MGRPRLEWRVDDRYQKYLVGLRQGLMQTEALIAAGFNGNAHALVRVRERDPEFIVAEADARRAALAASGVPCQHCGGRYGEPPGGGARVTVDLSPALVEEFDHYERGKFKGGSLVIPLLEVLDDYFGLAGGESDGA